MSKKPMPVAERRQETHGNWIGPPSVAVAQLAGYRPAVAGPARELTWTGEPLNTEAENLAN
jgi:hypothetical protein